MNAIIPRYTFDGFHGIFKGFPVPKISGEEVREASEKGEEKVEIKNQRESKAKKGKKAESLRAGEVSDKTAGRGSKEDASDVICR